MHEPRSDSIFSVHETVQWLENISEQGKPDLVEEHYGEHPMKEPDCCMAPDSFHLAQISLAASLPQKVHDFSIENTQLCVGPGLDGMFSRQAGFIGCEDSQRRLPVAFSCWEKVHDRLPILLRRGVAKETIDTLPSLSSEVLHLPKIYLARAALVLSALAHSYFFGHQDDDQLSLPAHIEKPWVYVSERLGRPFTGRIVADDILNNVKTNGLPFELSSSYFDLLEERLSSGLQGFMEMRFAPVLSIMTEAHNHLLAQNDEDVALCLQKISRYIVRCAETFLNITPQSAKQGFDPIIWIKTYPVSFNHPHHHCDKNLRQQAMGNPVREGELGNSGVDAPLFHALDTFLGRADHEGDLRGMQRERRNTLPASIQSFLRVLGKPELNIREYVERSTSTKLNAAFDGLVQIYAWFLERHRVKAVGITGVSLGTGKHTTSSGVKKGNKPAPVPPDEMLSRQMKAGIASRLGSRNAWQTATIGSITRGCTADIIVLTFPTALPLEAGDRLQIIPENSSEDVRHAVSGLQQIFGKDICSEHSLHTLLSKRKLHPLVVKDTDTKADLPDFVKSLSLIEPRFYSISNIESDVNGLATEVWLTVGHGDGIATKYWRRSQSGDDVQARAVPSLRFRLPAVITAPLVLIGQGSGAGPLLGFIRSRLNLQCPQAIGKMLLIIGARRSSHIIALHEMQQLTDKLPLTIKLALTEENNVTVQHGKFVRLWGVSSRVSRVIQEDMHQISDMLAQGGHVFVCGSSEFGNTVRRSLGKAPKGSACCLGRSVIPPPPSDWKYYHEDLFGHRGPLPPRLVTAEELAQHNTFDDCWTAIDGVVYDLTKYLAIHPGGSKVLIESAGTVADRRFHATHGGPYIQEVRGYLGPYAIGQLQKTNLSKRRQATLEAIVRLQNTLTNNTAFPADRDVPFYAYSDALLVFAEVGLEDWKSTLEATDEAFVVLNGTQLYMRDSFQNLRSKCWAKLADASPHTLHMLEEEVRQDYLKQIEILHTFLDSAKSSFC